MAGELTPTQLKDFIDSAIMDGVKSVVEVGRLLKRSVSLEALTDRIYGSPRMVHQLLQLSP
jgi:hypothetical protein